MLVLPILLFLVIPVLTLALVVYAASLPEPQRVARRRPCDD
jgi:hypothetical protein